MIIAIDKRFDRLPMTSHSRKVTTKKSKTMLSENGSRMTISLQLHNLIASHGLVNVIDIIRMLCTEQSRLEPNKNIDDCFHHLEKLIQITSKIETWN